MPSAHLRDTIAGLQPSNKLPSMVYWAVVPNPGLPDLSPQERNKLASVTAAA